VKDWEIIADTLHDAGWSLDWVSALDIEGRTIWIVDAHRGDGKRFVVRADERLTAFLALEAAIPSARTPRGLRAREIKLDKTFVDRVKVCWVTSSDVSTHLRPG